MLICKEKMDYTKKFKRADVHTSIRDDLYTKLLMLSVQHKEPASKMFDILLQDLFHDENNINKFIQKVKEY